MKMLPKVSIVIPGHNCAATIGDTLRACLSQDFPTENFEVIFVDDGSVDNTKDTVSKFPVKYIWQDNSGPAKARNRGWNKAGGEIICFTDSDCIPDKNWVSLTVKNFNAKNIGAVGGSYGISNPENLLASCIHAEIIWRHCNMPHEVRALGSYNLAIPKKILQELNGFDETYRTSSGEDNDLCYRITKKGYRLVFEPQALVYHRHPENLLFYFNHQFRHGFWRMKLYHDHFHMVKGDDYSGIFDYLPPLMGGFIIFLLPFFRIRYLLYFNIVLIICFLTLEILRTFLIFKSSRYFKHLNLFWILSLRDFWRGVGMLLGIIRFFILKDKFPSRMSRIKGTDANG